MEMMIKSFEVLMKGIIVSISSSKYREIAHFLSIEEHFEELDDTVQKIGYRLIGENGYYYLAKMGRLDKEEITNFVSSHKRIIVAISIIKQIYPLISPNDTIKQTSFTIEFNKKEDETLLDKMKWLFGDIDRKKEIEELFKLLEKNYILEKFDINDKDSYRVLNAVNYYVKIVESAF